MEKEKNEFYLEYILISLYIFVFLCIIRIFIPVFDSSYPDFVFHNDHYHYIRMAENPLNIFYGKVAAPFCYRILTPFIAWLLPFDLKTNFLIISFISFFLTSIVLYQIFKNIFNQIRAVTGLTVFFGLNWTVIYFFYNIWLSDSLAFLFIVICFWAIKNSNYKIYALSLILGVLTKEVILFTIPVFIISELFNKKENNVIFNKKLIIKFAFSILPAIIIFIIIRIIVIPDPNWDYNYLELLYKIGYKRRLKSITRFNLEFFYLCTISTWGFILCIFPFFNKKSTLKNWIKLYGLFMILIYSQLLFATDIERILIIGFYPMILLTLLGMQRIIEKKNFSEYYFLAISIAYFTVQLIISTIIL